jgi:hypothetical protein
MSRISSIQSSARRISKKLGVIAHQMRPSIFRGLHYSIPPSENPLYDNVHNRQLKEYSASDSETIHSVFDILRFLKKEDTRAIGLSNLSFNVHINFLPTDKYKLFLILPENNDFLPQQLVVVIDRQNLDGTPKHVHEYYSMGFVPYRDGLHTYFSLSSPHKDFRTIAEMESKKVYTLHDFKPLGNLADELNEVVDNYNVCVRSSNLTNPVIHAFDQFKMIHYGFEYNSLTGFKTVFKIPSKRLHTVRNAITMFATGKMKKKNKKNNKTQKKRIK